MLIIKDVLDIILTKLDPDTIFNLKDSCKYYYDIIDLEKLFPVEYLPSDRDGYKNIACLDNIDVYIKHIVDTKSINLIEWYFEKIKGKKYVTGKHYFDRSYRSGKYISAISKYTKKQFLSKIYFQLKSVSDNDIFKHKIKQLL